MLSAKIRRGVYKIVGTIVQCMCVVHCTSKYVGNIAMCVGNSMEPTLKDRDMLLVECISVKYRNFKRGDVIICKCPVNPDRYICKRVIGLAGDKVEGGIVIPVGHVWLQGDNTNNSLDSRLFGPVPLGLLRGRVFFKILPPNDIGLIATKDLVLG